ncbi:MAG: hypothetical protein WC307_06885 [Candidatus Nanoarchaeia archaeon]
MVVCKCGYDWVYKGRLCLASCPNCGLKVRVKPKPEPVSSNPVKPVEPAGYWNENPY